MKQINEKLKINSESVEGVSTKGHQQTAQDSVLLKMAFFMIGALFLIFPLSSQAVEIHVAEGGTGDGSATNPFGSIQEGIDSAQPGDVVYIQSGTYEESIQSTRNGTSSQPIVIQGDDSNGPVVLTWPGRVLRVQNSFITIQNVTIDGQYGDADAVSIRDESDGLVLRNLEISRSGRDCVDMASHSNILIEGCLIHHCLDSTDGRKDAHGVTGGSVSGLVIRDTEIHTFSGDGIQFDPGRTLPGWSDILLERCHIWLEPLKEEANGFSVGVVPGENAVDTKAKGENPRSSMIIRDSVFHGFRDGLIANMAALNIKENVDVLIERVTLYNNEIALRLRGPTPSHPSGAWVSVHNTVIYDADTAVRYENDIQNLEIWNTTLGTEIDRPFVEAEADNSVLDIRNFLIASDSLPTEAQGAYNIAVPHTSFVAPDEGDFRLSAGSPAIDTGETLQEIIVDRDGIQRPQGEAFDIGAYEWCEGDCEIHDPPDGGMDGGSSHDGSTINDGGVHYQDGDTSENGTDSNGCSCRSVLNHHKPSRFPLVLLVCFMALIGLIMSHRRKSFTRAGSTE